MGTIELDKDTLLISSHIITYGNAATAAITEQIRNEIETMWNEPEGAVLVKRKEYRVQFKITAACMPQIAPEEILANDSPLNNYFRIEEYVHGNISFVDGLGCNTGYFKLENLYPGSTTAAHEYGHTLGLEHPSDIDYRGKGVPGIMYPRGTLVDAMYQYDPDKPAGVTGGTMHPMYRKVRKEDIRLLRMDRLDYKNGVAIIGDFSSIWHPVHEERS
ncbi:peptidase M10 [Niabella ginsenosidivorans]|uniref:Peptidase M10 n=1 Tax=Niabella ginsenosidivorans TaxID=1176587 RepID=A0A1A9I6N0_9BACT|nr:peptidase M10 [Niabella ginsenosidivorans]ANH82194.1 peptidase M10 [Niabella ginsenosidivorans]